MLKSRATLLLIATTLSVSLSSCMMTTPSTHKPQINPTTLTIQQKNGYEPALKQTRRVNVGDVMFSQFEYQTGTAAQTTGKTFVKTVLFGDVKLPPGTLLNFMPEAAYPTYCTSDKVYYGMGTQTAADIACFADEAQDGEFERVQVPSVKFGTWTDTDGPSYSIATVNRKKKERQELLYQGRGQNTIKVMYRELNAQGEQTISQTAEYALAADGSAQIGYKKARLMVETADNSGVTYQVLEGFK